MFNIRQLRDVARDDEWSIVVEGSCIAAGQRTSHFWNMMDDAFANLFRKALLAIVGGGDLVRL